MVVEGMQIGSRELVSRRLAQRALLVLLLLVPSMCVAPLTVQAADLTPEWKEILELSTQISADWEQTDDGSPGHSRSHLGKTEGPAPTTPRGEGDMAMCGEGAESVAALPTLFVIDRASAERCPGSPVESQLALGHGFPSKGSHRVSCSEKTFDQDAIIDPAPELGAPPSTVLFTFDLGLNFAEEHRNRAARPPRD
jgi:hypothetical protein